MFWNKLLTYLLSRGILLYMLRKRRRINLAPLFSHRHYAKIGFSHDAAQM